MHVLPSPRARPAAPWLGSSGLALVLVWGCGARTGLEVEVCADAGSRPCEGICGPGLSVCVDGRWSECLPLVEERPCRDECGDGVQRCSPLGWSACEVEPVERACADECGEGTQLCADGSWSPCEVEPVERACADACGEGTQLCEGGTWSACVVTGARRECETSCGPGVSVCRGGTWSPCSTPAPTPPVLQVTVRDFQDDHPDFEDAQGNDRGIVLDRLGSDGLPVYAGDSRTTHGREAFDQWFRDVSGVNQSTAIDLPLRPTYPYSPIFTIDDQDFFPIDGALFGNQGRDHNYHFTLSAVTEFVYRGGEAFSFRGDDDVFVFINGRLVIDLGGVHRAQFASVNLDERADELGIEVGMRYPLHLFFAERHTRNSSFRIETTVSDPERCF